MDIDALKNNLNFPSLGHRMHRLVEELYPICRSITGEGFRQTLNILQRQIPLEVHEVPSGTPVFDWVVPKEWTIRDAYIKNSAGERVVDFKRSNLHVVSYSVPVKTTLPLAELKKHLHSLPERPDWTPYRTSYYHETWGFCLSHNQLMALKDEDYAVCIDSTLEEGRLNYGEYYIKGATEDEVLFSCHACHPSLCNDNLSGMAVTTFLAQMLSQTTPRYSYRFLFIPGTIGSIAWLSQNEEQAARIKHGLVVTCVGDGGHFTYKRSRQGNAEIDQCVEYVLQRAGSPHEIIDFFPYGYDERQYCSPGFDLAVGCLMRTPHDQYPEYHTSADDLQLVRPEFLADSLQTYTDVVAVLENNQIYLNQNPKCEPQLGKRGLYGTLGGGSDQRAKQMALLWVLNLADGRHSLLDIAKRSGIDFAVIKSVADKLLDAHLLKCKAES